MIKILIGIILTYLLITGIIYIRLADIIRRKERQIRILENRTKKLEKVIDKMADNLTTDYHDKYWIINYYMNID